MNEPLIKSIELAHLNVELTDSFNISQGSVPSVRNLLVKLTTTDGVTGYGEISPFSELSGEDRETCMARFDQIKEMLIGKSLFKIKQQSALMLESLTGSPAVRCGLEMSMLDALTRQLEIPLWAYWGGYKAGALVTDITLPISSFERAISLAEKWYNKGFRTLKVKVGVDFDNELKIITEINKKFQHVRFIIDANQAFEENTALQFIRQVLHHHCEVILFEQPVNRYDFQAMASLTRVLKVPVAADESVFSLQDLRQVIHANAARVINLKIMKTGIFNALQIGMAALSMGLDLMIGGMVETRLAMGCSASIALGHLPINYIDLDTPLLMESDPFLGGYSYCGPEIRSWDTPGLGMIPI